MSNFRRLLIFQLCISWIDDDVLRLSEGHYLFNYICYSRGQPWPEICVWGLLNPSYRSESWQEACVKVQIPYSSLSRGQLQGPKWVLSATAIGGGVKTQKGPLELGAKIPEAAIPALTEPCPRSPSQQRWIATRLESIMSPGDEFMLKYFSLSYMPCF